MNELVSRLQSLGGPAELLEWVASAGQDEAALWKTCPRGDWLLYLAFARRLQDSRLEASTIIASVVPSVREVVQKHAASESVATKAIAATEAWCLGRGASQACDKAAASLKKLTRRRWATDSEHPGADAATGCACNAAAAVAAAAGALGSAPPTQEQVAWNPAGAENFRLAYQKAGADELASALYFSTSATIFASVPRIHPHDAAERLEPERFAGLLRTAADDLRRRLELPNAGLRAESKRWWKVW